MKTGGGVVQGPQRQIRYLTTEELARLRRHSDAQAVQAREKGGVAAVRSCQGGPGRFFRVKVNSSLPHSRVGLR